MSREESTPNPDITARFERYAERVNRLHSEIDGLRHTTEKAVKEIRDETDDTRARFVMLDTKVTHVSNAVDGLVKSKAQDRRDHERETEDTDKRRKQVLALLVTIALPVLGAAGTGTWWIVQQAWRVDENAKTADALDREVQIREKNEDAMRDSLQKLTITVERGFAELQAEVRSLQREGRAKP